MDALIDPWQMSAPKDAKLMDITTISTLIIAKMTQENRWRYQTLTKRVFNFDARNAEYLRATRSHNSGKTAPP